MNTLADRLSLGLEHHQAGRLAPAEQIYREILAIEPEQVDALHLLGVVFHQTGRHELAIEYIGAAIRIQCAAPAFHTNLGEAHRALGNHAEAIASYQQALRLQPDNADACNNLGNVILESGNLCDAVACFEHAIRLNPAMAEAYNNLGNARMREGDTVNAAIAYRHALERKADFAEAYNNLGGAFKEQGRLRDAMDCWMHALRLAPQLASTHNNLGTAYRSLGQYTEAIACYRQAIRYSPHHCRAHFNLGAALRDQGQVNEAVASFRNALNLNPRYPAALGELLHQLQHVCLWDDVSELSRRTIEAAESGVAGAVLDPLSPFSLLAAPGPSTPAQQLRCAEVWQHEKFKWVMQLGKTRARARPQNSRTRIKVGYLSADFHEHATAYLMAELFERHDRSRFEICGYSYGPDDGSPMRQRLLNAFDAFVNLKDASFEEAARQIETDEVDILVDLKGYTTDSRTEIPALRPAPVQVNYLGFPGTMGAPFMDYILVDDFIVPMDQQACFTEKLVHLPGCYQVNDSRREISPHTPSRADCGLPDDGFVFCSFNNTYKITPEIFSVWMELLHEVPGSVLWLFEGNPHAPGNLRREAEARGVRGDRLVFALRRPLSEHLARHRLADLFLDTCPYNAHTTASDALWAGCPVLTLAGKTFASRVAGSLLRAVGLPELITTTVPEYHHLALRLARDADLLSGLRLRLEANRRTSSLFDAELFARNIEQAYVTMWEIALSGAAPRAFAVTSATDQR